MTETIALTIGRKAACGTCSYWEKIADRSADECEDEGLCRRHAPVAIASVSMLYDGTDASGEKGHLVAWPRTFADSDWCGDFALRADLLGRLRIPG